MPDSLPAPSDWGHALNAIAPSPLHQRLDLSLYVVATAPYSSLDLAGLMVPAWTLSHVVRGEVFTETRGLGWRVGPGDVMVHPPNVPFAERAPGPGIHQWTALTAVAAAAKTSLPIDLLLRHPVSPVVALGARAETYHRTFVALEEEWRRDAGRSELRIGALATLLLDTLITAWQDAGATARPEQVQTPRARFLDLIAFMEQSLEQRITRDDLARRACLHPGSLDRAFRAVHGGSPMQTLQGVRLARARHLLETTDNTLDHIAGQVGLGDAARLSRLFRAHRGLSPGAYRERAKNDNNPLYSALLS